MPKTFRFNATKLPYYRDYDGDPNKVNPQVCERTVELPIGYDTFTRYDGQRRLEVGNTLEHWYPDAQAGVTHDVVDKFEHRRGVLNTDILDYQPAISYDLVLSLSTLEHVGKPEYGDTGGDGKAIAAVKHCIDLLAPGGFFLATIPRGWNETLEQSLRDAELRALTRSYMVRVDQANHWAHAHSFDEIADRGYDCPWPYANAIYILTAWR